MAFNEVFDALFLQADVDCDGVISGAEAVNFFKATNLPQPILAKIWKYADDGQRGFLSRHEFYHALKLVTIVQTGNELTLELVKAALTGPSATQIPPPHMTSIQSFPKNKNSTIPSRIPQVPYLSMTSNLGSEHPWPRMTTFDVQRYAHVFNQINTNKEGKITGDQTRELFLSWQLPREVLRHVWNLADEDGDDMLSLREFCTTVYLLEKFTEGYHLPARLPMDIHLDKSHVFDDKFSTKHLKNNKGALEGALKSIDQLSHTNYYFINKNKESKEFSIPRTTSYKHPVMAVDLRKKIMSQKEKATYCRLKLQEIGLFKSQCDNKLSESKEMIFVLRNEVDSLSQHCELHSKFALKVETQLNSENTTLKNILKKKNNVSFAFSKLDGKILSEGVQTEFDHTMVDLLKLKKMLLNKARSLDVEIKQELSKKIFLGNIKDQESTKSFTKDSNSTIPPRELSTTPSNHTKEDIEFTLDNFNCLLHSNQSTEQSLNISTTNKDLTTKPMNLIASNGLHLASETLIADSQQLHSSINPSLLAKNFLKEAPSNSSSGLESTNKISSVIEESTFTYNLQALKPHLKVEEGSMMMIKTNDSLNGENRMISNVKNNILSSDQWKMLQDDDKANVMCQASQSSKETNKNIEVLNDIKMSKSRGSFEVEDLFDLTQPHALSLQSQTRECSTMASRQHIKTYHNHEANCPNYLHPKKENI